MYVYVEYTCMRHISHCRLSTVHNMLNTHFRNFNLHVFSSSKGGSFVRPKKVSGGMSCFLAVNDRYGQTSEAHAGVIIEELFVIDEHKKQTKVEMVGAEKVNRKQRYYYFK